METESASCELEDIVDIELAIALGEEEPTNGEDQDVVDMELEPGIPIEEEFAITFSPLANPESTPQPCGISPVLSSLIISAA